MQRAETYLHHSALCTRLHRALLGERYAKNMVCWLRVVSVAWPPPCATELLAERSPPHLDFGAEQILSVVPQKLSQPLPGWPLTLS